jgi:hypothetical protein
MRQFLRCESFDANIWRKTRCRAGGRHAFDIVTFVKASNVWQLQGALLFNFFDPALRADIAEMKPNRQNSNSLSFASQNHIPIGKMIGNDCF